MAEESKARYTIVRVENNCPHDVCNEEDFCFLSKGKTLADMCNYCDFLDEKIIIGDTKEQLVRKIAQVLLREELEWYRENLDIIPKGKIDEPLVRILYEHCLDKAKKIVEFLGVK